jgi:glycosyltransferase involved in cell wall biosynthesis
VKALRVAMVTRRYWPLTGGAATVTAQLAAALPREGIEATVVTPRWEATWPVEMRHRGTRVVRLPMPRRGPFCDLRYAWRLSAWLRRHAQEFDVVYVSELKHDAAATVHAARRADFRVVLRAENSGLTGDCHWQINVPLGRRIKHHCFQADAFLAPSPTIERELIAAGYARDRIYSAPSGVSTGPPRTAQQRAESRAVLAELGAPFKLEGVAPLAVFVGRLTEDKRLPRLLQAWSEVALRRPDARLWLVGEGPLQAELAAQVNALGLAGSVLLPGAFDIVDELLQAADLFVYPVLESGNAVALLEAMAYGLPIVASDIPDNRRLLEGGLGTLVPEDDAGALSQAIEQLLSSPELAGRLASAAQEAATERCCLEQMVSRHAALLRRVAECAAFAASQSKQDV